MRQLLSRLSLPSSRVAPTGLGKRLPPRSRKWLLIIAVFLLLVLSFLLVSLRLGYLSSFPAPFVDELEGSDVIRRLLVIAPHCDDEVLAAGGLIQKVLRNGGEVLVVLVTNGDGSLTGTMVEFHKLYPTARDYLHSGERRQEESLAAMQTLGVATERVLFLGYPDRGIMPMWQSYWEDGRPYRSPFTGLTTSPYERTFNGDSNYSGQSLLADLSAILGSFCPDTVVAPHLADSHPDHWATGAFTALALSRYQGEPPRLLLYLVHRGDFPVPRGYLPFAPLLPPLRLVNDTMFWYKVTYPDEIVEIKGKAMEMYRSQLPLLGSFLRSFVRQNEMFGELILSFPLLLSEDYDATPVPWQWTEEEEDNPIPILLDSARDTVSQEIGPGGDFVALYAAETERELWLVAQMRGNTNRFISYRCYLRAATAEDVVVEDMSFHTSLRRRDTAYAVGPFLLVRFSRQDLAGARAAVVSFESRSPEGLQVIDRLGWMIVPLSEMTDGTEE